MLEVSKTVDKYESEPCEFTCKYSILGESFEGVCKQNLNLEYIEALFEVKKS